MYFKHVVIYFYKTVFSNICLSNCPIHEENCPDCLSHVFSRSRVVRGDHKVSSQDYFYTELSRRVSRRHGQDFALLRQLLDSHLSTNHHQSHRETTETACFVSHARWCTLFQSARTRKFRQCETIKKKDTFIATWNQMYPFPIGSLW